MASKQRNPRNEENNLFKHLTRLFSGPIVQRRTQLYRQEKRRRLDKWNFTSASGKGFKKATYSPFEQLQSQAMANQNRNERYIDFDQMEYSPEIASSMDIYADEMTTSTSLEEMLKIDCPNEEIKAVLKNLYFNVMNVEFNLFGWCRTMCKYGDFFLYLDIDDKDGITNVIGLPAQEVERLEGEDVTNPNYVQFQWNSGGMTFENWQVGHFRILGNDKYAPYGTSVLEPARRIWRQLTLLEDAMMAYRIVRSPERRVFYIDIGNIAPEDVEQFMQKVITTMKRNQVIDDRTGRVDLRYNPLSIEEDYFLPTHGPNTSTKVESLPGGTYTGDIDDVKYLRDKLFSALKVPQSYLSRGEGADEDKATLAQKDIRFARTIQRLQRSVIAELEKIGIIHLYTLGFRGDDLISHTLSLNNPSKIAELQELEHWRTKFDVASAATDGFFSKRWVAANIFGLTDEEFLRNQREMFYDRKFEAELDMVSETAALEGAGGGGLGDFGDEGGDLGGEDLGGEGDLGGDEAAPEDAAEDETLLAAPGKREDRHATTTALSKGKMYTPRKHKGGDRRKAGARRRSNLSKSGNEARGAGRRSVFAGSSDLFSIADGIFESYEDSYYDESDRVDEEVKIGKDRYKLEESRLFRRESELKDLMSDLETSISSETFAKRKKLVVESTTDDEVGE